MIEVGNIVRVEYPTFWADRKLVRVVRVWDFDGIPMVTFDEFDLHHAIPMDRVVLVSRVRSVAA